MLRKVRRSDVLILGPPEQIDKSAKEATRVTERQVALKAQIEEVVAQQKDQLAA